MKFEELGITLNDLEEIEDNREKFHFIGEGASSKVFVVKSNPDLVVKWCTWQDEPFRVLMECSQEDRDLMGLPQLHDTLYRHHSSDAYWLLERCYDADFTTDEEITLQNIEYGIFTEDVKGRLEALINLRNNVINKCQEILEEGKFLLDFHRGNIMIRKTGELVLIDPVC